MTYETQRFYATFTRSNKGSPEISSLSYLHKIPYIDIYFFKNYSSIYT